MVASSSFSCSLIGNCCLPTWTSYSFGCCCISIRSSCSPTTIGCCTLVATHLLPNIWTFAFVLTSFCFGVVLPKFKLLERGTWANTLAAICLCNLSLTSFIFTRNQTLLKIFLSHPLMCFWILMIFALIAIIACYVVLVSFPCLLISLSLSPISFYIILLCRMPKYWFGVTWNLE